MKTWEGRIRKNNEDKQKKNQRVAVVNAISLDDWVSKNNIERIDFIKADIEGAESLLLRGATEVLKTMHPKLAICTYHYKEDPQILQDIILKANPEYKVQHKYKKMYAYV